MPMPTTVPPEKRTQVYLNCRLLHPHQLLNLETAVGRKTNVQDIGVPGEIKTFEVTSVVMRHFFILPGEPRACADFCDPTADSRFKGAYSSSINSVGSGSI